MYRLLGFWGFGVLGVTTGNTFKINALRGNNTGNRRVTRITGGGYPIARDLLEQCRLLGRIAPADARSARVDRPADRVRTRLGKRIARGRQIQNLRMVA